MEHDLAHLQDHIELVTTALELRARGTDNEETARGLAIDIELRRRKVDLRRQEVPDLLALVLERRLQLSDTEMMVVWCLATLVLNAEAQTLLAHISGGDVTLRAIKQLVYGDRPSVAGLQELSGSGTLRRFGILESTNPTEHESKQTWTLCARVLELLHGKTWQPASTAKAPEELIVRQGVLDEIRTALRTEAIVLAIGAPGLGRRTSLVSIANELGIITREIDCQPLAKSSSLQRQLQEIALDCRLFEQAPLLTNLDAMDDVALALVEQHLVAEVRGPVLGTSRQHGPTTRWKRPTILIGMGHPSSEQLEQLWKQIIPEPSFDVSSVVTQFSLAPAMIHRVAAAARARSSVRNPVLEDIQISIRTVLDTKIGELARHVDVTQTWEDIVLPQDQLGAVAELIARVRGRRQVYEDWGYATKVGKGLGVTALFSGPPGTGKTMVASLIARDLGLPLYQVDLGKVVSKWIGETEKNLGQLFDAAEAGHAVLLFDEADALFTKRTEVRSSNDRNANMETNYLLQRLESFTGVCLLTTNHETYVDPAVQRRLSLHLRVELPDVHERAMLWRALLPESAPIEPGIDFDGLAERFEMSGGYIRNASLRAAFIASARGSRITGAILEHSARRECEAMGKLV